MSTLRLLPCSRDLTVSAGVVPPPILAALFHLEEQPQRAQRLLVPTTLASPTRRIRALTAIVMGLVDWAVPADTVQGQAPPWDPLTKAT